MKTFLESVFPIFLIMGLLLFSRAGFAQDLESIPKQKPFTLTGSINARGIFYNANGIEARRKPFSYFLNGNPTATIYGITIPFSFTYSEQERSFRQPFNQFGMSPFYKWVTVHAGYRNINWSPFTMAGHTILGGGIELTPGILRFGFIYGRLNRATGIDTLSGSFQPFAFTRKGYAARIGLGNQKHYLDFSLVKAKDDSNSVKTVETISQKVDPAENAVFGVSTKVSFTKNLYFQGDGALSLYTRNLRSDFSDSLMPNYIRSSLGKFIKVNGTSEFYTAYQASLGYKDRHFGLRLQYKRIDADFKSMGAYFFNSDVQNITIAPSAVILKNKVRFNGSIGFQRDNLQNQKEATSNRVIGSANLSADFTEQLGIDINYSNYSNNQRPGAIAVADSFLIAQTTQNFSVTPRYFYTNTKYSHVVLLSVNYMTLNDLNQTTKAFTDIKSTNNYLSYQITFIPSNLLLSLTLNSTVMKMSVGTDGNQGVTVGINKGFLDSKLMVGITQSVFKGLRSSEASTILNTGFTCFYRVHPKHTFNLLVNYVNNKPKTEGTGTNKQFSETKGEIGYTFNF